MAGAPSHPTSAQRTAESASADNRRQPTALGSGTSTSHLPDPAKDFDGWVEKIWSRMDRDGSGSVERDELNCELFHDVVKSVLVPETALVKCTATYARASIHAQQVIAFCLRKADHNKNGKLSFAEFKAFMRALSGGRSRDKAQLVFEMFDLDGSQTIDKEEFREMFRYFAGRHATAEELQNEWERLDRLDARSASLSQYMRWIHGTHSPVFAQLLAAPKAIELDQEALGEWVAQPDDAAMPPTSDVRDPESLLLAWRQRGKQRLRPVWKQDFNAKDFSEHNIVSPSGRRTYFSRPQSLPELTRHCTRHKSPVLQKLKLRLSTPDTPKKTSVLSTETFNNEPFLSGRFSPGGSMRNKRGELEPWIDEWNPPRSMPVAGSLGGSVKPGSLALRMIGPPMPWLLKGKDVDDDTAQQEGER